MSAFLNEPGLEGLGALKMILKKPNDSVELSPTNGLLAQLQGKIDKTLAIYEGTHITEDMSKKEVVMRYDDLTEAEGHVKTMLFAVKKEPFMEKKARDAEVTRLEKLLLGLRRAFNPIDLTLN